MTVAAMLLIGWYIYQPATSSVFLLDDRPNLAGLAEVGDARSALQFVTSGSAGPVGRPLALATFLPQAAMWDDSAAPFIQVNILIHLVNGLLAWLFFLQLVRARKHDDRDGSLIAIGAMALWLFLPLLASSSLMIVQRMATLAATFILLGLNGYLYARAHARSGSGVAITGMTASIVIGTALAVLAKENGAVLPSLVLVIEATLLRSPANVDPVNWRRWRLVFLVLPTLAIFVFMGQWNNLLGPVLYLSTKAKMTLTIGLAMFYHQWGATPWNLVMAGAVLSIIPVLIVFALGQEYFVKGMIMSGIKG